LQKDSSVSVGARSWSLERLNKEICKCQVLCANCHRKCHKNYYSITQNKKRIRNRLFVEEYRKAHCCEICGEDDEVVLDFHHHNEKDIDISRAICDWGLERLKKEIMSCQVLCANCHRKTHNQSRHSV
jgi:hypothetical protein